MGAEFCTEKSFLFMLPFFLLNQVTNAYILRLPCLMFGNFSIVKPNYKLKGYSLGKYNDVTPDDCENRCIQNRLCKSIETRNTTGRNCRLNSKSSEDPFDDVTLSEDAEWTHKTTDHKAKNIGYFCAEKSPCRSGYTCVDSCTSLGYECQETTIGISHNCQDAYNKGYEETGVIPIYVPGLNMIHVRCDMITDGGGWIVFQRRINSSVDFYRGWNEYKNGFGDLNGNFWLGLEKIHKLAPPGRGAILRVDLKHSSVGVRYAEYSNFSILDESNGYTIQFNTYSGDAGDSLTRHRNKEFSTHDHDQDSHSTLNCAQNFHGAWWYDNCYNSHLNGLYPVDSQEDNKYMTWKSLNNRNGGVIFSEMKIKYYIP